MTAAKDLIFYTNPMSRGRIARWMLEETGVPYQTRILEYGPPMKTAEFLAINPMGKVPALRHGETVVTETPAILAYLADAFPEANLAPPAAERGAYYRWLFFCAGPLEAAVTCKALGAVIPEEKRGMVGYGSFDLVMDTLTALVRDRPYIAGDAFSAADIYLGSQLGWGIQFGTIPERPEFSVYLERLKARPAYKQAREKDDSLTQAA